jgi:hypothetical protein
MKAVSSLFRISIGLFSLSLVGACKDARSELAEGGGDGASRAAPEAGAGADPQLARALPDGWRSPRDGDEREALLRSEKATQALLTALMQRLTAAMGEAGGVVQAVRVCADEAQTLTTEIAEKRGVALGRSSKRLRNPENAPPRWVAQWLDEHDEQPAAQVEPMLGISERDGKRFARYVGPIGVQPLCLTCHGPAESIVSEVRAILAQRYPSDEATGYAVGDLRGAVWAELEVETKAP